MCYLGDGDKTEKKKKDYYVKIIIETIPHKDQRYPTVGDWFYETRDIMESSGGPSESTYKVGEEVILHIKVSQLSDWRREMLVAVHELVEVLTCKNDGVSQESVDKFDVDYEKSREAYEKVSGELDDSEPGDDPKAPYVRQHCLATGIERILAQQWGVVWKEYEDELCNLP